MCAYQMRVLMNTKAKFLQIKHTTSPVVFVSVSVAARRINYTFDEYNFQQYLVFRRDVRWCVLQLFIIIYTPGVQLQRMLFRTRVDMNITVYNV